MHRTQLQLDEWQYEALRSRAQREGRSLAAVVRDIVGAYLTAEAAEGARKLQSIAGLAEGPGDASIDHDAEIYDADAAARSPPESAAADDGGTPS